VKRKYLIACLLIFANLFVFNEILAASFSPAEKLDHLADQTLQFTKVGRYDDAENMLKNFGIDFESFSGFSANETAVIHDAKQKVIETFQAEHIDERALHNQVTSFRLAVDAVQVTGIPLWTRMQSPMMDTFVKAEQAMKSKDQDHFNEQVNLLIEQYEMIAPSLQINMSAKDFERLEAEVNHINEYRSQVFLLQDDNSEMKKLKRDFAKLFKQKEYPRSEPSIFWVIAITAGIIVSTLSYVGWRKFKAERRKNFLKN